MNCGNGTLGFIVLLMFFGCTLEEPSLQPNIVLILADEFIEDGDPDMPLETLRGTRP
jgi:hypothetical protein